ncbi:MAG: helix-turn-helix domain-containing protein [Oscillospiraceae bacterium]|nr:helix-turn-helix domain-containing protein [Oscillospiraceae bacterium]
MDMSHLIRLLPTMEVIEEAFTEAGWHCAMHISEENRVYRNVRLFTGQQELLPDVLYTLRPGETDFPVDRFAYVCTSEIPGSANHICCPDQNPEDVLDFLLDLYSRYQQQEILLDQMVFRNSSLQDLCQLGETLLDNPICIHDDWFMMLATSSLTDQLWTPEYAMSSAHGFIPRVIVDDFKHDSDYLETYAHRDAQIWVNHNGLPRCLYVNLWEGTIYRGRFLIMEANHPFRRQDTIIAEVLAQRAMFLLRENRPGKQKLHQSMDDVVFGLLQGAKPDPADLTQLLGMLQWNKSDQFLCIRIQSQQSDSSAVMEHLVHSDLFRSFPESYILLSGHQQCVILNLTQQKLPPSIVRHRLAPICRDYCLYAGISSPVPGIRDLHLAYYQANTALTQAFHLRNEKWILFFSECALDYIHNNISGPLQPWHLVAPELNTLILHDREKDTQYFETFREYLLQERDIPRTAQALIIHRTTLLYRLKKIRTLINVDLEDPWQRLYLTMSLWIMEKEVKRDT